MNTSAPPAPHAVYWHRELPPSDAEPIGDHTVEATSARVPGTLSHRDEIWDRCYRELMDCARVRLEQEIARLGGDCAHVSGEHIEPRHDDRTGEAWMYGRFDYELYRLPAYDEAATGRTMTASVPAAERHDRFGLAWVALSLSLAAHVVDEALTGFLDVYNPIVQSMRVRFPWFPMPVFTFDVWIAGLCLAVGVVFALSPLAYRRSPFLRVAAYPYAVLMVLNGAGHLLGSVYLHRWAPGATTAPVLIASSLWLLAADGRAWPPWRASMRRGLEV